MSASECNSRLISADLEYKLAGLVSARLRAERRRRPKLNLRFKLASNFAERDPVSEIALTVKWLEDGKRRRLTYFVQLKPSTPTNKQVTIRELRAEDGHFSLVRCYQQYKNLRAQMQAAQKGSVKRKRICGLLLDDCRFVIFSTREVFRGRLSSKASSAMLFPFEDVFSTGVGEVFSFGERDEEVWSLLDGEDKTIFRKEFLPRLRIFSGQAPSSALDALLTKALVDAVGSPLPREQATVERLKTALRLWWQRADGRALSESSHEIDEALREDIMATADTARFDFDECSCHELREVLRVNRCVYLAVPGVSCHVRCSKIRKVLEENLKQISKYSRRFIILSEATFHEYNHDVLKSLCAYFCDVLVVDLDSYSDKILTFLLDVIDEVQKLMVVSSSFIPKVRKFLQKHGRLYKEHEDSWTLKQLSATQQEQLLRRRVVFQGYEMSLGELEGAWPSLRDVVGGATLEALEGGGHVTLGAHLPPEHPNYVPRKLQHRSQLRGDVFDHRNARDYFLLSGFPESLLQRLRSPKSGWEERELMEVGTTEERPTASKTTTREDSGGKTKWCVWNKVSPPDRLAEKLRENVHWLAFEGSTIIWKHTYGDNQVLGKYVDRQSLNCQSTYICSHNDMNDFLNWNNPTILLAGDVGIGKSAFMIRMANRIKQGRKTHWVVLLTINQGQILESLPSHIKLDDVVHLLDKSTQNEDCTHNKLNRHFLKDCLEKSGSIAVLVDVVAEICPMHMAKVQRILALIQESRAQYLCVAATTSSDSALKNVLKCSPSTLQPFSTDDQQRYLLAQWGEGMERKEKANLQKGLQRLVEIVGEVTDYEGRRLCEVPLYTRMLSVAYNGEERAALVRNCQAGVDLKMSALTLYRKFVQEARKSFRCKRKLDEKISTSQKEDFMDKLKSHAAYLCFSDRKLLGEFYEECKSVGCELKRTLEFDETAGLLRKRSNGCVGFVHHTFREYFAALWCADRFPQLPHLVRALYSPRGARVRGFFDALLAEGHALHEAALSGRRDAVEACLSHGLHVDAVDRGGRRALHLCAAYGHAAAVQLLLAAGAGPGARDHVRRRTPLQYADEALRLAAAERLLEAGADPKDLVAIPRAFAAGHVTYRDLVAGDMVRIMGVLTHPERRCPTLCKRRPPEPPAEMWEEAALAGSVHVAETLMSSGVDLHRKSASGMTALHITAFSGNEDLTRLLLKHGARVNEADAGGETALHKAVRCGHSSICQELLAFDADCNLRDDLGRTPLYQSVIEQQMSGLWKPLLEHDAEIDAQTSQGTTALLAAARFANEAACRHLLSHDANAGLGDASGTTPLHAAAEGGDEAVCRLLLSRHADVNARDADGRTPLHRAARSGQDALRVCRLLLEFGAQLDARDAAGATALLTAVRANNVYMTRTLFRYRPDVNACDATQRTALHEAVIAKSDDVRFIVDLGADVNSQDADGCTALHFAVALAQENVCRLLIERGANVRATSAHNGAPLHAAARAGHLWISRLLIEHGADVCCVDAKGTSALHCAATGGHEALCCLLLQQGADPNVKNARGQTALAGASAAGHETVCRMLLEYGADVHSRDARGQTALHAAARNGYEGICHVLLTYQADVNARDGQGRSALQLAATANHKAVCSLLLSQGADARLKDLHETSTLLAAACLGNEEICSLLLENGADIRAANCCGMTPLHAASKSGHEGVCRLLLDHESDVNAEDARCLAALDYATNPEVYKLLRRRGGKRKSLSKKPGKLVLFSRILLKYCPWFCKIWVEEKQS